jgi:hypothetical protein
VSNYFQSLKRLEQEQAAKRAQPEFPLTRVEPVAQSSEEPAPRANRLERGVEGERQDDRPARILDAPAAVDERTVGSYTALFDNLRAIGEGAPVGSVVVCGVSAVESVDRISNGLAEEVCRHSLRVLVAELFRTVSQPILKIRLQSRSEEASHVVPDLPPPAAKLTLDLRGGPVPQELTAWMGAARAHYDMIIIEAPPLSLSVDAAMLARACDGLILAVAAHGTSRDALKDAVARADTVGCPLLGVVMQGRPEWTPRWLRRLTGTRDLF